MGRKRKVSQRMIAPQYLSDEDLDRINRVTRILWVRSTNDAFIQCLRVCVAKVGTGMKKFKPFIFESPKVYTDGHKFILRLSETEIEHLDMLAEKLRLDSRSEAIRVVIRFGEQHFVNERL